MTHCKRCGKLIPEPVYCLKCEDGAIADQERLDKLNRFKTLLSLCGFDEFYFADVRAWIDELEESHE